MKDERITILLGSAESEFVKNLKLIPTLEKDQITDVIELFVEYLEVKEKLKK